MTIVPQVPKINAAVLDIIGREFKFDHVKGISEWIKNSVDAYNNSSIKDEDQFIIIALSITDNQYITKISVLDFHGMSKKKIDQGFKDWFSPDAAKLTNKLSISAKKTFGGHGNGGKFYMRQMFKTSKAITYYNNKMNIFGFNKVKQYGFDSKYNNFNMNPNDAINMAGIDKIDIPDKFINGIINGKHGFSLIIGEKPIKSIGTNYLQTFLDKLNKHPQANRLISKKCIYFRLNGKSSITRLQVPKITPMVGFEEPHIYKCPNEVDLYGTKIRLVNKNYPESPELKLFTSKDPLKGSGGKKDFNRIDLEGEIGVIASYQLHELGNFSTTYIDFIYGECKCPIMEDEGIDCVRNDREQLVVSAYSSALKSWIFNCISELSKELEAKDNKDKEVRALKSTSDFNKILNKWKNKFVDSIIREVTSGLDDITGVGGGGIETAIIGQKKGKNTKKRPKSKGGERGGSDTKKAPSKPNVLISGYDIDPFSSEKKPLELSKRHHAIHQRSQDVKLGIYWINTSKSLAKLIINKKGYKSAEWRSYLFNRYVDIIVNDTIFALERRNIDLNADSITINIQDVISQVQDKAVQDLSDFLLDNEYDIR